MRTRPIECVECQTVSATGYAGDANRCVCDQPTTLPWDRPDADPIGDIRRYIELLAIEYYERSDDE